MGTIGKNTLSTKLQSPVPTKHTLGKGAGGTLSMSKAQIKD